MRRQEEQAAPADFSPLDEAEASLKVQKLMGDVRLGADLLWRDLRVAAFLQPTPALFLDRDGVIIEEKEYICRPEDVELLPGSVALIRTAREVGMAVVVVTNQAGIGRGYFGWLEHIQVENRVAEVLAEQGERVDAIFACPFHESGLAPYDVPNHPWRKPNPGMLVEAAKLLNLDLRKSILVGDKASDQEAARAAELAFGVHVLTGHGRIEQERSRLAASKTFPVRVVDRADQAVALLQRWAKATESHDVAQRRDPAARAC